MTSDNDSTGPNTASDGGSDIRELRRYMDAIPGFSSSVYRNMYEGYRKRFDCIDAMDSVRNYRVVFIGEPGKGKTTTICNWLGLLSKDRTGSRTKDTVSLLTTASGRTTVSEVHIRQVDGPSRIEMTYCDDNLQTGYIRAFAEMYWYNFHPEMEKPEIDLDTEVYRFIRNMAGLKDVIDGVSEKSEEEDRKTRELMSGFRDLEEFTAFVEGRIDLPRLKLPSVTFDGKTDFEDWLKKTFRQLNYGEYPGISLMNTTTLCISRKDCVLRLPKCIGEVEIIDTKGLDTAVRPDLRELMLADDTICFLMDDLNQVPSGIVCDLIKNTFRYDWDRIKTCKVSILAKSTLEGLGGVTGADDDPERGEAIKRREVEMKCAREKVPYDKDNTLFANPVAAYRDGSRKVPKMKDGKEVLDEFGEPVYTYVKGLQYDDVAGEDFSRTLNRFICRLVKKMREYLSKEVGKLSEDIRKLVEMEREFQECAVKEMGELKARVSSERMRFARSNHEWDIPSAMMYMIFEQNHVHWARIKKLNRIYGAPGVPYGDTWPNDIYTSIRESGLSIFASASEGSVGLLKDMCIDVRNEKLRQVTDGLRYQIDSLVKEASERVADGFRSWALEEGFHPLSRNNPFWSEAQDMCGSGYTKRIKEHYKAHIASSREYLNRMVFNEIDGIFASVEKMFDGTRI